MPYREAFTRVSPDATIRTATDTGAISVEDSSKSDQADCRTSGSGLLHVVPAISDEHVHVLAPHLATTGGLVVLTGRPLGAMQVASTGSTDRDGSAAHELRLPAVPHKTSGMDYLRFSSNRNSLTRTMSVALINAPKTPARLSRPACETRWNVSQPHFHRRCTVRAAAGVGDASTTLRYHAVSDLPSR